MNQQLFEKRHREFWTEFDNQLGSFEMNAPANPEHFAPNYRQLCAQLALARHRAYAPDLVDHLNELAQRGHRILHSRRDRRIRPVQFIAYDFPRAVRREWRWVGFSATLFVGLWILGQLAVRADLGFAYATLGPQGVADMAEMYDPNSPHRLRPRGADTDVAMFGFYIMNNIGIGFRTFASGIFAGIGSVFFVAFNGLVLGVSSGVIDSMGFGETFYPFIIGHGSFELTAIVIAGAAGTLLGSAIVLPGRRTIRDALRDRSERAYPLVIGFVGMLTIAAVIEAFWSSSDGIPASTKYAVGGTLWVLVLAYFAFAGARRAH